VSENRHGSTRTPAEARALAREISADLAALPGDPLVHRSLDLTKAFEQVLFTAFRAPEATPFRPAAGWRTRARGPAAAVDAVRGRSPDEPADLMVLLLASVHHRLFVPVADELGRRDPRLRAGLVRAARAARDPELASLPSTAGALRARDALTASRPAVDARAARPVVDARRDRLSPSEASALVSSIGDTLVRLRIEAMRLDAAVARVCPRAIAAYDEIDAWSRLVAAVAARRGIVTVDLPHAEAADAEAIRGVGYDLMGVFGPRAARVVGAAGVDPARVRIVGPAAFDAIVLAEPRRVDEPPRVVMAAQYRNRLMTDDVRAGILDAAAASAAAIGAVLKVCPHPVESLDAWTAAADRTAAGRRVVIDVEPTGSLHRLLPGAALMVTGWSNSVFESVLAGVPALTVHLLPGDPPVSFASEGIAAEAKTADEAARIAPSLASEPGRSSSVARARTALEAHLGPLDGRAAERTADLLVEALA